MIHGRTPKADYSLIAAAAPIRQSSRRVRGSSETASAQEWAGVYLLKGAHISVNQRYSYASFMVPGLWNWLGPSLLNYHNRDGFKATPDEEVPWTRARLPNGSVLELGPVFHQDASLSAESYEGFGAYRLASASGVTFEEILGISISLARLHAIVAHQPMDPYSIQLSNDSDSEPTVVTAIEPHPPEGLDWGSSGLSDPFFDTSEIDFEPFICRWLELGQSAPIAIAAAAPRKDGRFVSTQLVDTANAIEAISHAIFKDPELDDRDKNVVKILQEASIDSDLRRHITYQLKMRHSNLESKLIAFASRIGSDSARWLLGPSIKAWAYVAMRVRNSLVHGKPLPEGLSADFMLEDLVERSMTAVLQLGVLYEAGYRNKLSQVPGEMLQASGKCIAGHPNSNLFRRLTNLASYAPQWIPWCQMLRSANMPTKGPIRRASLG